MLSAKRLKLGHDGNPKSCQKVPGEKQRSNISKKPQILQMECTGLTSAKWMHIFVSELKGDARWEEIRNLIGRRKSRDALEENSRAAKRKLKSMFPETWSPSLIYKIPCSESAKVDHVVFGNFKWEIDVLEALLNSFEQNHRYSLILTRQTKMTPNTLMSLSGLPKDLEIDKVNATFIDGEFQGCTVPSCIHLQRETLKQALENVRKSFHGITQEEFENLLKPDFKPRNKEETRRKTKVNEIQASFSMDTQEAIMGGNNSFMSNMDAELLYAKSLETIMSGEPTVTEEKKVQPEEILRSYNLRNCSSSLLPGNTITTPRSAEASVNCEHDQQKGLEEERIAMPRTRKRKPCSAPLFAPAKPKKQRLAGQKREKRKFYPMREFFYCQGMDIDISSKDESVKNLVNLVNELCPGLLQLGGLFKGKVLGVSTPQFFGGRRDSGFGAHKEDGSMPSIVIGITGLKLVVLIDREHDALFQETITQAAEIIDKDLDLKKCARCLQHRRILPTLEALKARGISYEIVKVTPGHALLIPPNVIHFGVNIGATTSLSVNLGTAGWARSLPRYVRTGCSGPIEYPATPCISFEHCTESCIDCKAQVDKVLDDLGIKTLTDAEIDDYEKNLNLPQIIVSKK